MPMKKFFLLFLGAIAASEPMAAEWPSALWGAAHLPPVYQLGTMRGAMRGAEDLPPLIVAPAQACFDRTIAEVIIHFSNGLPAIDLPDLSPSLGEYDFPRRWLRSKCSLDANFTRNRA